MVKSGDKNEDKHFLGYEFSNRRGSEGIHPIQRGKNIDECTALFDPKIFDNPEKASTYIYKAFQNDHAFEIAEALQNNISRHDLVDLFTFDRVEFEKSISLAVKKKGKIESKWEQIKLEDIAVFLKRGKSAKYGNSSIQIIKSGQARGYKEFDFLKKHFVENSFELDERQLQKGDILINSSGVGTAGRVTLFNLNGTFVADSHVTILRPNFDKVNADFVLHCLAFIGFKNLEALAMGQSGQIELTISTTQNIRIPLPPKNIQDKIVAEIKLLEEKEENTKQQIEELNKEIKDNYILSKDNFPVVTLSNEIKIIGGGTPSTGKPEYWNGEIPWLSIVDFKGKNRFVEKTEKRITEQGLKNSSAKYLDAGDIIISARGTVGALAQLKIQMTFNQSCYGIKANSSLLSDYLYFALKFEIEQFQNNAYGQIFDAITTKTFDLIKIPLPPLKEQQTIVNQIEIIESKIAKLEQELFEIPVLKEAVLKKYL